MRSTVLVRMRKRALDLVSISRHLPLSGHTYFGYVVQGEIGERGW